MMSPPMEFILEWNSRHATPSPRSIRLAPALLLDLALGVLEVHEVQTTAVVRKLAVAVRGGIPHRLPSALRAGRSRRRRLRASWRSSRATRDPSDFMRSATLTEAEGIPHLERSHLPAEAPLQAVVDG